MSSYPSRKERTRRKYFQTKKRKILIIINFWLLYFILIGFIPLTSNTYSYFNDVETISNSIEVSDNFCADKTYKDNHKEECKKKKDNSGIGNGPEPGDGGEGKTDPDNPKHGNDDDHPKPPNSSESKGDKASAEIDDSTLVNQENGESINTENSDNIFPILNNESDNQDSKDNVIENQDQ